MTKKTTDIAVIGLGLLGTSLCMALDPHEYRRIVWSRSAESRAYAKKKHIADIVCSSPEEAFSSADIVVLCIPIPNIVEYIGKYSRFMKKTAVLTDIGSVKSVIETAAAKIPSLRFVGSHPMAGTEKNGCFSAFPELYANADVFVVPPANARKSDVAKIVRMWRSIGTKTTVTDAGSHDALVAATSHVPHMLASALTLGVLETGNDKKRESLRYRGCATGFRDTSRIASSSARMWREIIENNTPSVLAALGDFRKYLDTMESAIASGDYDSFEKAFARGKVLRDGWMKYKKY